mgnify:CR=1 FL=1
MCSDVSREAISEAERLLRLPMSERESEGVYANDSQLKLLLKKLKSRGGILGATKFVADFTSMDSKILSLVGRVESERDG